MKTEQNKQEAAGEGARNLREAIDAWNNRDAATANYLFKRAEDSFKKAGKLDQVRLLGGAYCLQLLFGHTVAIRTL